MQKCEIANQECEGQTACRCFSCGLPVCKRDSIRLPYSRYGVKRICVRCIVDHDRKGGEQVVEDWYHWQGQQRRSEKELRDYRPLILSIPKAYTLKP